MNECTVNNGEYSRICNDAIPGHGCSYYLGYQLLSDGMNCNSICHHNLYFCSVHLTTSLKYHVPSKYTYYQSALIRLLHMYVIGIPSEYKVTILIACMHISSEKSAEV